MISTYIKLEPSRFLGIPVSFMFAFIPLIILMGATIPLLAVISPFVLVLVFTFVFMKYPDFDRSVSEALTYTKLGKKDQIVYLC